MGISLYLADRKQCIHISAESSSGAHLQFGVPQGSVLGPLLFILYATLLGDIARRPRHGLHLHLYADDTQGYVSLPPENRASMCGRG